jgi:hypothetical protein
VSSVLFPPEANTVFLVYSNAVLPLPILSIAARRLLPSGRIIAVAKRLGRALLRAGTDCILSRVSGIERTLSRQVSTIVEIGKNRARRRRLQKYLKGSDHAASLELEIGGAGRN